MSAPMQRLLAIMARLRGAGGCPWDRAQTFASIAPFTIEESYEVADAIERNDMAHLKDELGDLLFQVVFHAQLAEEAGHFNFDAVAGAIIDKLVRRHPHVFARASDGGPPGGLTIDQQSAVWEDIKAAERHAAAKGATTGVGSALEGVPLALPALMRACKLSRRAARVGFDFERVAETADKVAEELAEVREAAAIRNDAPPDMTAPSRFSAPPGVIAPPDMSAPQRFSAPPDATASHDVPGPPPATVSPELFEEVGDLLFAAANLARKLEVDAEAALRAANIKFERRFSGMERLAAGRGLTFATLGLAAQEALWQEVKRAE